MVDVHFFAYSPYFQNNLEIREKINKYTHFLIEDGFYNEVRIFISAHTNGELDYEGIPSPEKRKSQISDTNPMKKKKQDEKKLLFR